MDSRPQGEAAHPGALAGWQVLLPGAPQWGRRVAGLLAAHGARSVLVPVIESAPPTDLTPLDSALGALARGEYDWLVVTSPTTVLTLAARAATLANRGRHTPDTILATFVGGTKVATQGPGCARALARSGVTADLVPAGGRSCAGLLARFPAPPEPVAPAGSPGRSGRVLVTRSDLASSTVGDTLGSRGWRVDDLVAYRTLTGDLPGAELRAQARAGVFDAVLLGAPSTVDGLVELVGAPPAGMLVGCVGPRTALTARDQGLTVDLVPQEATAEALVEALVSRARSGRTG